MNDKPANQFPSPGPAPTLRDLFAMMPLNDSELESAKLRYFVTHPQADSGVSLAELRYFHADCMIAERQK